MLIDTISKTITITSIYEYVSISKNVLRYHKKIKNKYNVFEMNDIKTFCNYQLVVIFPHVLEYENYIEVNDTESKIYLISDLYKNNLKALRCQCVYPNDDVINFIEQLNSSNIRLAEIGIRYCITSKKLINKLNSKINNYDLFEKNLMYANRAKEIFKDNNKINVYEGDASVSLKNLNKNIIYDFVHFDASHVYDIDKQILNELENHINKNTIIWFDDYNINDVKILTNEFNKKSLCISYVWDSNNEKLIKL